MSGGKYGLWKQMMNGESYDLPTPSRFDGHIFAVQQTMIKSFPMRLNCQVPVFAAQKLRSMADVAGIESLKIGSIRQAFTRGSICLKSGERRRAAAGSRRE